MKINSLTCKCVAKGILSFWALWFFLYVAPLVVGASLSETNPPKWLVIAVRVWFLPIAYRPRLVLLGLDFIEFVPLGTGFFSLCLLMRQKEKGRSWKLALGVTVIFLLLAIAWVAYKNIFLSFKPTQIVIRAT